jgi:hypothetical protein
MARELNLLSEESAVYLARLQVDLGTQVGAWRKASAAAAMGSAAMIPASPANAEPAPIPAIS